MQGGGASLAPGRGKRSPLPAVDSLFLNYTSLLATMHALQDSLFTLEKDLKMMGNSTPLRRMSKTKFALRLLLDTEHRSIVLQSEINRVSGALQQMEMNFLMDGIISISRIFRKNRGNLSSPERKNTCKAGPAQPFDIPIEGSKELYYIRILDTSHRQPVITPQFLTRFEHVTSISDNTPTQSWPGLRRDSLRQISLHHLVFSPFYDPLRSTS